MAWFPISLQQEPPPSSAIQGFGFKVWAFGARDNYLGFGFSFGLYKAKVLGLPHLDADHRDDQ